MNNAACEFCESAKTESVKYSDDITFKGLTLHLDDLERSHCLDCDYTFETMDAHDKNLAKIRAKFIEERAALKKRQNLLSGQEIRQLRNELGLTQKDAAELFGGGANAFSKYENEEIVQAVAMDKLLRLVAYQGQPGVQLLKNIYHLNADASRRAEPRRPSFEFVSVHLGKTMSGKVRIGTSMKKLDLRKIKMKNQETLLVPVVRPEGQPNVMDFSSEVAEASETIAASATH